MIELQEWQDGLLAPFEKAKLLAKDVQTQSLECTGCEHRCFMPVYQTDDKQRAFIVCNEPSMQDQMGRISVHLEKLQQWQASAKQLAAVVSSLIGMKTTPAYQKETASYKLGMLISNNGRRWLTLLTQPLLLEANRQTRTIADLLYFNNGKLEIDLLAVDTLLNATPPNTGKDYTPSTSKREARKQDTQAMYQNWRDEYQTLLQKHPSKPDTWHSQQISKLPIAQGRDSETIRKRMKM